MANEGGDVLTAHAVAGIPLVNLKDVEARSDFDQIRLYLSTAVSTRFGVNNADGVVEGVEDDRSACRNLKYLTEAFPAAGLGTIRNENLMDCQRGFSLACTQKGCNAG